jgi:hypothetical protein
MVPKKTENSCATFRLESAAQRGSKRMINVARMRPPETASADW